MGLRTRAGFTLIELLVVVSIVALLAALLFPVYGQAKERAIGASCLSNLKQISYSWEVYRSHWDGAQPLFDAWEGKATSGSLEDMVSTQVQWHVQNALIPGGQGNLGRRHDVWKCPKYLGWGDAKWWAGYTVNGDLVEADPEWVKRPDLGPYAFSSARHIAEDIPDTSETILLADSRCGLQMLFWHGAFTSRIYGPGGEYGPGEGAVITHGGKRSNYLFCDLHVGSLRAMQTLRPVNLWLNGPAGRRPKMPYTLSDMLPEYR